jgi:hypothetical protein
MVKGSLEPDEQPGELSGRDAGVVASAAKRPVTFHALFRAQSSSSERRLPVTRLPNNPS